MKSQILKKILVAGDAMLDRYWFGDTNRISPEAPVPVVRITREEKRLGGAANVALNIRSLGACVKLLSVVGHDDAGSIIESMLREKEIEAHLHYDSELKTTVKLRIIARQQQMLRADFENHPSSAVLAKHLNDYETLIDDCRAIVLSDYGKGGLDHIAHMIDCARAKNIPVLIDPKGSNYERYRGATVITPNRTELAQVVGIWDSEKELNKKFVVVYPDPKFATILFLSHPFLIFTVTGFVEFSTTFFTICSTNSKFNSSLLPSPFFTTFGAGHPIFTSKISV